MAHAAVALLLRTLHNLDDHDNVVKILHDSLCTLQSSLENIFPVTRKIKDDAAALESRIRDEVFKAQDIIDSFLCGRVPAPQPEGIAGELKKIRARLEPIVESAKEIAQEVVASQGTDPVAEATGKFTSRGGSPPIVGQGEDFEQVKHELKSGTEELKILSIIGVPGIGKTTLARSIYEDRPVEDEFIARAWVTVSPEDNVRDVMTKLLASVDIKGHQKVSTKKIGASRESDEGQLAQRLCQTFNTRYLVVIDDMRKKDVWEGLKPYFPQNKNRSRIILTTRHMDIADHVNPGYRLEMQPLNHKSSWMLFCDRVFGDRNCPSHLEIPGWKIAKHCRGVPLLLTVIGGLLAQERETKYWEIIEQDMNAPASDNGEKGDLELLALSYNHLPSRLKGCFLYMGAFPENTEIPVSRLLRLWVAEGFLKDSERDHLEAVAKKSLDELIDRNLVTICKLGPDGRIKSCGMHDVVHDLAMRECEVEKFLQCLNRDDKLLPEGATEARRRLFLHRSRLMPTKEDYDRVKEFKSARTLLIDGDQHDPHPFPFSIGFDSLRVLDALTLYFPEFPDEVVHMIQLSYLSLTYNGNLPPTISNLRYLQVLIVLQRPGDTVTTPETPVLPAEIWKMPQLKHLALSKTELPDFSGVDFLAKDSVFLGNLQSLSNVNAARCTLEVLRTFPNVEKLGMWVETRGDVDFNIVELEALAVFKFTVRNPVPGSKIAFKPELAFPRRLRKLSLTGCGIPWEDMTVIGQLEFLEVLKLRESAHLRSDREMLAGKGQEQDTQGKDTEWNPVVGEFLELKYLLLEGLNLYSWKADDSHFPSLETLIIRHCYNLEKIPLDIGAIGGLELIEMVDGCPNALKSAHEIRNKHEGINRNLRVRIYSS